MPIGMARVEGRPEDRTITIPSYGAVQVFSIPA
jgi:hypothetical protein